MYPLVRYDTDKDTLYVELEDCKNSFVTQLGDGLFLYLGRRLAIPKEDMANAIGLRMANAKALAQYWRPDHPDRHLIPQAILDIVDTWVREQLEGPVPKTLLELLETSPKTITRRLIAIRDRHLGINIVENGLDIVLTWDLKPGLSLTIIAGGRVDFTFVDYSTAYWLASEQDTFGELVSIANRRSPIGSFMESALRLVHKYPELLFTGRISNSDTYGRLTDRRTNTLVASLEKDGWESVSPRFTEYLKSL
jgi:hypothetical protein